MSLELLHENIQEKLIEIESFFVGAPKLTLVIRFPNEDSKSLYLSIDTKEEVIAFLQRFEPARVIS